MIMVGLTLVVVAITLLPRWKRHRVRVTGVSRVRSEMALHPWPLFAPLTPVGGKSTSSRNVPPTGPKQPDDSPRPPTTGAVRCRHRVAPGDPNLGATLSSGWRMQ